MIEIPKDPAAFFADLECRARLPVERWAPAFCGEIDIRIARDGTWYYLGSPIGRRELVRLFASVLRREPDGRFMLVTPVEKVGIQVDDAPFVAVEMEVRGGGRRDRRIALRTNVDDVVEVDGDHPIRVETDPRTGEPAPYVLVRDGLEALIGRAVFYELVALAEPPPAEGAGSGPGRALGVWSGGRFFRLGEVDD